MVGAACVGRGDLPRRDGRRQWSTSRWCPRWASRCSVRLLLGAAIVLSVLIGQGKLWPGSGPDRTLVARLVLAGLNVFAILAPLTFTLPVTAVAYVGGGGYCRDVHSTRPPARAAQRARRDPQHLCLRRRGRAAPGRPAVRPGGPARRGRPGVEHGPGRERRSPARGSTAPRPCSTSSRSRSVPSRTAPACPATPTRPERRDSRSPAGLGPARDDRSTPLSRPRRQLAKPPSPRAAAPGSWPCDHVDDGRRVRLA